MKKIVLVVNYPIHPERIGGMDRFFWALNHAMKSSGYAVQWIFPDAKNWEHYIENGLTDIQFLPSEHFIQQTVQWVKANQSIDLLLSIFSEYNGRHIGEWKRAGIKKILIIDQMSRPTIKRNSKFRFYYFLKGLLNYNKIDRIIAVSNYVKTAIANELGVWWLPKTTVIYNSVDTSIFKFVKHKINPSKYTFFTIAHLIQEKGIQTLIEAIASLKPEIQSKVNLLIAGDGLYKKELQQLVNKNNLSHQVTFLGNITNQQEHLLNATVCVVPSLWNEAFGYTNIEAMAVGCPLIASHIGGIPEIVENNSNGILFKPNDAITLSHELALLVTDEHKYERLQLAARKSVENKFELNNNISSYMRVIQELVPFNK